MRRRVVARDLTAAGRIDRRYRLLADTHLAGDNSTEVRDHPFSRLLRVLDAHAAPRRRDRPRVADLAARLRIERGALDENLDLVAFDGDIRRLAVLAQRHD